MESVTKWLEKKLFLKVSASKTKVVRPTKSNFLGFTFWKTGDLWKCRPTNDRKAKLCTKVKEWLRRKNACARSLAETFTKLNQIVRGWINYFKIGGMGKFLKNFGEWMRHKVRVVILKQWKRPKTIYKNLMKLNHYTHGSFTNEDIRIVANARLGWYRRSTGQVINFLLSPTVLATKKKDRPGLIDPYAYYLSSMQ